MRKPYKIISLIRIKKFNPSEWEASAINESEKIININFEYSENILFTVVSVMSDNIGKSKSLLIKEKSGLNYISEFKLLISIKKHFKCSKKVWRQSIINTLSPIWLKIFIFSSLLPIFPALP